MENLTLTVPRHPVFQAHVQQSHPRLSLTRVLRVRFLRWLDKASSTAIGKAALRALALSVIALAVFAPQTAFAAAYQLATWNSFRIPAFLALSFLFLNLKPLLRWYRRASVSDRAENQHTFHGLPVGELASFLKKHESFKLEDAQRELALSKDAWKSIAEDLEKNGVLTRGEKNARVLRPIGHGNLVRQLRDNFPLVWSEDANCFVDKLDGFAQYQLRQEFTRKKLTEETQRRERKLARIEEKIAEAKTHPLFAQVSM